MNGDGIAFKLTPSGSDFDETIIHTFRGFDGAAPQGTLVSDTQGNLYGVTSNGGEANDGTVFELVPNPDGTWSETVLHSFGGGSDGQTPLTSLTMGTDGSLFGTTYFGGDTSCPGTCGTVFQLTNTNGTWTEQISHAFKGAAAGDGKYPQSTLVTDEQGSLYGATSDGGNGGGSCGGCIQAQFLQWHLDRENPV